MCLPPFWQASLNFAAKSGTDSFIPRAAPICWGIQNFTIPLMMNIKIGKENHLAQLENSTVLVARYNVGQDNSGVIGVIGPVRMDYSRLIPHLEYFAKTLGDLLSDTMNPAQE